MRIVMIALIILLGWLQYSLWFGKNNLRDYFRITQQIKQQQRHNAVLIEENQAIWAEVHALSYGTETLEELARAKLNMIKPGEIFYFTPVKGKPSDDESHSSR